MIANYQKRLIDKKCVESEPEITKDIQDISAKTDVEVVDLEFRINARESYDEKYAQKSLEKGRFYKANDVVRNTFLTKKTTIC